MKRFLKLSAITLGLMAATACTAGNGMARIEHTNVAAHGSRSVDGFKLIDGNGITPFVEAKFADAEFYADDVVIMPEWVSAEDPEHVNTYLASIGITDYKMVLRCRGGDDRFGLSDTDIDGNGQLDDIVKVGKTADRCKW